VKQDTPVENQNEGKSQLAIETDEEKALKYK
jgi:hypothetical protein